jgi:flavin-dependent dehydrogenase
MLDVLIAGAGPAGSIAALVLARAGARVLIVDREVFPRDKLCGDTLNPGAVAFIASLGLSGGPLATARTIHGMRVTGPTASVCGRYGDGIVGLAIARRDLDWWLLQAAIAAGAHYEPGVIVRRPLVDEARHVGLVRGLVVSTRGRPGETRLPSTMVVAADGRRSVLARHLGLRRDPPAVRRWAFGVYASGVDGMQDVGEMHVRHGWYLGLAPLGDDLVNVCLVTPPRPPGRTPLEVIRAAIDRDPLLLARLARARFLDPVRVLGPLAADVRAVGAPGLLLAGDASGFVDPMTGDGLLLAMQGARLAALETVRALETGDVGGAIGRLAEARHRAFGRKVRFNRWMRRIVATPAAVDAASAGARIVPGLIRSAVRYAGDVP